jgi:hypothetical protein
VRIAEELLPASSNTGSFDCVVLRFANDNFAQDDRVGRLLAPIP